MRFPCGRKTGALRKLMARALALLGGAGFACTFPDYVFVPTVPDTCSNGKLDEDETQVDCGGECPACKTCLTDDDCTDLGCVDGLCAPTCDDGALNGDETAVDCGGTCPTKCSTGDACRDDEDCEDHVCDETCQAPTCSDKVQNGDEPSVDCGAECPKQCPNESPCNVDADCISDVCADGSCAPPECANGTLDEDNGETDTDCGGASSLCPRCEVGDRCLKGTDCKEGVCTDKVCQAPTCDDGVHNGRESDGDCGGPTDCDRCQADDRCTEDDDCIDGVCLDDVCQAATCEDDTLNALETDTDCGGDDCEPCGPDRLCLVDEDCASRICVDVDEEEGERRCTAPTCDDGVQNGKELGRDCGGGDCPFCSLGQHCSDDAGCASFSCEDEECVPGVAVDYACGQCGEQTVGDFISYTLVLKNLTENEVSLAGLSLRYYLSPETMSGLTFECTFRGEVSCGSDPRLVASGIDNPDATHYVEVRLFSKLPPSTLR